ncbi:hypothetical protein [Altibacter sp.]|uniref:FKBP-type peptidyl-prolyl cis-trans isomerase n=1 Tax=Altibacter sp. TaxID=2024823 RepID=UPI002584F8ED|nr:hypothetical protein [Altibacter sp.]MCW8981725.1 hypothetical protein [Altibacter sp.]MCW9037950.1 hypothetical protein [Altibacter sp.]
MKKAFLVIPFLVFTLLIVSACKNDDGDDNITPPRDRGEESLVALTDIESFLETHFYNYEEFENPPIGFDYVIKFDSLVGDNANKIPLIEQVEFKTVKDRIDTDVSYKLYYLNVRQGGGEKVEFSDIVTLEFEGRKLDLTLFDSANAPIRFDLTSILNGLQDGLIEFNTAEGEPIINSDGTVDFQNFGVGAVFVPSGLGYFNNPPGSIIALYDQLIFSFKVYEAQYGDQDEDGIPTPFEDLNNNGWEEDDDTDNDGVPNYGDTDDENDGRLTKNEITVNTYTINEGDEEPVLEPLEVEVNREINSATGQVIITAIVFHDQDGDGTPDYLDPDN